jgi:hypothetical protein
MSSVVAPSKTGVAIGTPLDILLTSSEISLLDNFEISSL